MGRKSESSQTKLQQTLLASLFDETERHPLSVSELTVKIRDTLEKTFATVWVEGEISNFRQHTSGHWYFTLKDEFAQLRSACYRSSNQRIRFRLEDGLQVRARGRLSVYEQKGEYQLIVETLERVGPSLSGRLATAGGVELLAIGERIRQF